MLGGSEEWEMIYNKGLSPEGVWLNGQGAEFCPVPKGTTPNASVPTNCREVEAIKGRVASYVN